MICTGDTMRDLFACGGRDGLVRLWDMRNLKSTPETVCPTTIMCHLLAYLRMELRLIVVKDRKSFRCYSTNRVLYPALRTVNWVSSDIACECSRDLFYPYFIHTPLIEYPPAFIINSGIQHWQASCNLNLNGRDRIELILSNVKPQSRRHRQGIWNTVQGCGKSPFLLQYASHSQTTFHQGALHATALGIGLALVSHSTWPLFR
jgi:hypothetical protein